MMKERKDILIKSADVADGNQGLVSGVAAVFDQLDHDGDIIRKGAIAPEPREVFISGWGHNLGIPHGVMKLYETDKDVRFDAQYNLDTQDGRDAFAMIKAAPHLTEWSVGFTNTKGKMITIDGKAAFEISSMDVFHVAPVQRGAQRNTRTTSVKSEDKPDNACGSHGHVMWRKTMYAHDEWEKADNEERDPVPCVCNPLDDIPDAEKQAAIEQAALELQAKSMLAMQRVNLALMKYGGKADG